MPVVLAPETFDAWLNPSTPLNDAKALLKPAPEGTLKAYKVSRAVNSATHEGQELIEDLA